MIFDIDLHKVHELLLPDGEWHTVMTTPSRSKDSAQACSSASRARCGGSATASCSAF
jgi:hypothetical protein